MDQEKIILTAISGLTTVTTLILAPLFVNAFRRLRELEKSQAKSDEFHTFLKTYLLREAVLTFHSNPNPDTDKIIEKISEGGKPTREEYETLERKIQQVANNPDARKQQLKAQSALDLLHWAYGGEFQESAERKAKGTSQLFLE